VVLATTSSVGRGQVLEALAVALVVGAIAAAGHWAREEGVFPFRARVSHGFLDDTLPDNADGEGG
jgi:hypothetical protein